MTNFQALTGIADPNALAEMAAIRRRMSGALKAKDIARYRSLGAEHRALMGRHAPAVLAEAVACRAGD